MRFIEFTKQLSILDCMILNLDEKSFSDAEIATILEISKQTIHNCKARNKTLIEALKIVESPPAEYGNHEVNIIVDTFKNAFGTTKVTKYDRFAAKRLSDKHTAKSIHDVIIALSASQKDKYSPTVNSVSQLEEKLPQVIKFLQAKSADREINL